MCVFCLRVLLLVEAYIIVYVLHSGEEPRLNDNIYHISLFLRPAVLIVQTGHTDLGIPFHPQ